MITYIDAVFISSEVDRMRARAVKRNTLESSDRNYWATLLAMLDRIKVPGRGPDGLSGHCCRVEQWHRIKLQIICTATRACCMAEKDVDVTDIQELVDTASLDANRELA